MIPQSISRLIAEDIKMRLVVFPVSDFSLLWSIVITRDWMDVSSKVHVHKPPVWWADSQGSENLALYWALRHVNWAHVLLDEQSPLSIDLRGPGGEAKQWFWLQSGQCINSPFTRHCRAQSASSRATRPQCLVPRKYSIVLLLLLLPQHWAQLKRKLETSGGSASAKSCGAPGNLGLMHLANTLI